MIKDSELYLRLKDSELYLRLKTHAWPLLIVFLAAAIGQTVTLVQSPLFKLYPDSIGYGNVVGYIQMARNIQQSPIALINTFRLPGYPFFLADIFEISGGVHFPIVVAAQACISLLAIFECYILAFRLSHRRWIACLVASSIGANLYILGWERTILSEALSWWSLITLFLFFERFLRRPGFALGAAVAIAGIVAIMIRPFNLFLVLLLLAMALLKFWRSHELRVYWKSVGAAVLVLCAGLAMYAGLNAGVNGYFGLSYESNQELFAKVLEYHMQDLPVPSQYAALQADANAYVLSGKTEPWYFAFNRYPTKHYYANNWRVPAGYAEYIVLHHPTTFLRDSLRDLKRSWLGVATFYAPSDFSQGLQLNKLVDLSKLELDLYLFLPLFLIGLGVWVWRYPHDIEHFLLLTLGLVILAAIGLSAMGNYTEFYRTRSPVDWGMILLGSVVLAQLLEFAIQRELNPSPFTPRQQGAVAGTTSSQIPREAVALSASPRETLQPTTTRETLQPSTTKLTLENLDVGIGPVDSDLFPPEISIVLPCLNEEEAIGGCIDSIREVIAEQHLSAEILVVDNASIDRSAQIARAHGARVVYQPMRGYGNAYLKGFAEARGRYIVMADADNSYDFHELTAFVEPLRRGYDLVMGDRFRGRMAKGAMTWSHRYIGNPVLSGLLNLFFRTGVRDAHCGMRAFKRQALPALRLQTGGMEFASEMVINAAKAGLKITELPISYHPRTGETKLRTMRDGWRHLRFLLLYSPTHLFLIPGVTLVLMGLIVLGLLVPGPFPLFGHDWNVHTMILASVISLLGLQIIFLGLFARFFSLTEELDGDQDRLLQWLTKRFTLERGLLFGAVILGVGVLIDGYILVKWIAESLGPLNEVRPAIFATTLVAVGTQVMFGSFFLSFLQFRKQLNKSLSSDKMHSNDAFSTVPTAARAVSEER